MMPNRARGFALIEVTVAIAILGIVTVATGVLMERVPVNGREVRDQDLALKIARNEIEILRAGGYAALPANGPFTDTLLSSLTGSTAAVAISDFNAQTKQATVDVSWQGTGLTARSVSLTTLITQNCGL